MFSRFPLRILYFPCYVEVSPSPPPQKKQPLKHFSKHLVSDGQIVLVLKHKCTFI